MAFRGRGGSGSRSSGPEGRGGKGGGPGGCGGKGGGGPGGCGGKQHSGTGGPKGSGRGPQGRGWKGGKDQEPPCLPSLEEIVLKTCDPREDMLREILPRGVAPREAMREMPPELCCLLVSDESSVAQHIHDRGFPNKREKEEYLPAATVVWNPYPGTRLWVGSHFAADNEAVCKKLGLKAKLCAAGTEGPDGYRIKDLRAQGVHECVPFPINLYLGGWGKRYPPGRPLPQEVHQLLTFVKNVHLALSHYKDVMIYCVRGANRSAAAAVAVITWASHMNPELVVGLQIIHRKTIGQVTLIGNLAVDPCEDGRRGFHMSCLGDFPRMIHLLRGGEHHVPVAAHCGR